MSIDSVTSNIKKGAAWAAFMGVLIAAAGVAMMCYPLATGTVTTIFFGWCLVIAAAANVVFAFNSPSAGPFFLKILLAIVYGIAGFGIVANPAVGIASLTVILGTMLVVQAGVEFGVAIYYREVISIGWLLLSASVSLVLGLMILFSWPVSSTWAIGTLVGAGVLVAGITRINIAANVHEAAATFDKLASV